ncbi:hypothetical protein SSX86_026172 [Deinandra increscens subsp. villosa]|uniref:Integrase catalytic domain-containing protein n=1 Tax=Deinandra increscens subsp. villosa TaxID=3103831 RepID=A0AAP0GNQ6_9ASTR
MAAGEEIYNKSYSDWVQEMKHCTFCNRDGHNRDGCFKRIGYPEWWPGKGKAKKGKPRAVHIGREQSPFVGLTDEQYKAFLRHFEESNKVDEDRSDRVANTTGTFNKDEDWIVDSGATEHTTYRSDILTNRKTNHNERPVIIPNGDAIPVNGRGDYTLPSGTKITDVLHVSKFNCNLLSVSRLTKDLQCSVTFFPDFCVLQGLRSKTLIGVGECKNGLYRMGIFGEERKVMAVTIERWHKRLGHASDGKLSKVDFFKNVTFNLKDKLCVSCAKAKHTKLPFGVSHIKTKESFELLHCDIWGKYRTPSFSGANYFLTIVDDFTRSVWVFLIKHKSDASRHLIDFHKMVENQFEKRIKRIRCDNGGEFTSTLMTDFYKKQGILLETTCPHTPQQNGVVERKHRHLLETARALRFEANIPKKFWGECILTATYIINRLPSKTLQNKTPFEMLFNRKPDYDHMRVFGCLAYFRNNETRGDKFEVRGRPGVFLGYPPGTKGYKIYDIENKKIIISRDARFFESEFPFLSSNQVNETPHTIESFPFDQDITHEANDEATEPNKFYSPQMEEDEPNNSITQQTEADQTNDSIIQGPVNDDQAQQDISIPHFQENETTEARPKRAKAPPKHFSEFIVKLPPSIDHTQPTSNSEGSTVHPITNYISYDKFSDSHRSFLAAITTNHEPKYFKQAMQDPKWVEAMKKEIQALENNNTWTLEPLPEGKRAIDSKWVYKIKYKPNGEIERYKARLVAKGFTQTEGVDFHDTFAPVAKLVTVRTLLAVAVKKDWIINQLDVNNAFLHGDLDEEVYMKVPQGFSKENETRVCRLRKSLYGLKQASRNWYKKITNFLLELGFVQSRCDHSLYIYKDRNIFIAILIYVDDVIIVGNNSSMIQEIKTNLDKKFSIKDLGILKYFLGIEVARTADGLVLSQRKYILDILVDSGMEGCKPSSFPMEQNLKLGLDESEPRVDANSYRRLIGRLLYLQATRPDVAYSVNVLSQFVADPRRNHLNAANRILRYLKSTPGLGILLPKGGGTDLVAYSDSDWLGCPTTRRSRTGYLLLLGGAPISWKTKKQSVVSRSSAEAEYRAMATTVSEILWMRWLLQSLGVIQNKATPLHCDNEAARHIANNPVFHERTKHVEMDCYFVRERVESQEIQPIRINTKLQIADLFTKGLGAQQLHHLLDKLGTRNLHAPP